MANKSSTIKTVLIIIFIFIFIPCCTFFIVYKTNSSFRDTTNKYLKEFPGVIGEYASAYPTDQERQEKLEYIADYYLSLSKENASDKLYGLKKDNEKLYFDILKQMQSKSSYKTEDILKILRNREIRKDSMVSLYDDILEENNTKFGEEIKRYEKLGIFTASKEIEERYIKANKSDQAAKILSSLDVNRAANIMYYLNKDYRNLLYSDMSLIKKNDINNEILSMDMKKNALIDKAKIYETKSAKEVYQEIGNTKAYTIDELSRIYSSLSTRKAGEVLAFNKDNTFYNNLMDEIRKNENLVEGQESTTIDISKVMNFYTKHNTKVNDLVEIYEKMNSNDLAKIIDRMVASNNIVDSCKIENGEITITDSQLIIDVLKKLSKNTLSELLNQLEARKATDIIRKLSK
ncbi:hypothetical protein PV797_08405 [Clostridiaceae bacterium M8S5]|nr:hypothetical protein PV797_08405 [Clostridiaceae bacterium M8S5]